MRDLEPRFDPKGGSPKTPIPIPVKDLQAYVETTGVDDSGLWKAATTGACGLLIGMTVAWWTALQSKGMTQGEKEFIALQQSMQDEKIGQLMGHKDRIFDRLNTIEAKHIEFENSITDAKGKIRDFGNYVEEQRKAKR